MVKGKSAMVWQLRMWQGGDPARQVQEARALGLSSVSIKVTDGFRLIWEPGTTTNFDLLAKTVFALRNAGIEVLFWGWLWGRKVLRKWPSLAHEMNTPAKEARAAIAVCRRYGVKHFDINAEASYMNRPAYAAEYCTVLANEGPQLDYSLCSYRYPLTYQPGFPIGVFAPNMDAWSPQVYFLLDNRLDAGAIQVEGSKRQYDGIRKLPYFPVAPTYPYGYKDAAGKKHIWTASKPQLLGLFKKAEALGCEAISIWDLPQATPEQKAAVAEFQFATEPGPPLPPPTPPADKFWLAWPVSAPKVVTQAYGIHPEWYKPLGLEGHEGIDMRAPNGTPVYAMADGKVIRVEPDKASGPYGVQVRVEHKAMLWEPDASGAASIQVEHIFESVYAHFAVASIAVSLGQNVRRGEKLGLADNTGNSSGAHLHITLKHRGHGSPWMGKSDIVDPTPYLPDIFPGNGWVVDVPSNLRTAPYLTGTVVRLLQPNTVLQALEANLGDGDWWMVRAGGDVGYIWNPGFKLRAIV